MRSQLSQLGTLLLSSPSFIHVGLVSFIRNGANLARESGACDRPLRKNPILFQSPPGTLIENCWFKSRIGNSNCWRASHSENVWNGYPERYQSPALPFFVFIGITLIVGGGFHGKSTLLSAIEMGVYNLIPGDGREYVVTEPYSVKVRAEDGRYSTSMVVINSPICRIGRYSTIYQ